MNRYAWGIKNQTTNVTWTSSVLSFNFTNGRQSYLDNYNAGALTFTIKNQANESAGFSFGDEIRILNPSSISLLSFYVVLVSYNDYPGNTGLSTATITCQDAYGLMGRLQMNNFSIAADRSAAQWAQTNTVPGKIAGRPSMSTFGFGQSFCSAGTYSGSVLNLWNLLVNTERGVIALYQNGARFVSRDSITIFGTNPDTFSQNSTASSVGYEDIKRINLGLDLMNQVQTQPAGLAVQQGTNAASVASVGAQGFTVSSLDSTTTQALGLADWLANTLSDSYSQRFEVTFTDLAQNASLNFERFMSFMTQRLPTSLTYRVPGAVSDTTVLVIPEGYNLSATPSETTITAYLSPLTYYQFFTLNSSTLGILDTSRLGW